MRTVKSRLVKPKALVQVVRELEAVTTDVPCLHFEKGIRLEQLRDLYHQATAKNQVVQWRSE